MDWANRLMAKDPKDRAIGEWIEILSAYPKSEPDANKRASAMAPHLAMINAAVPQWIGMGGRPDWAKNWQYIQPKVAIKALYPDDNIRQFNAVRRVPDPNGMFVNPFLRDLGMFG